MSLNPFCEIAVEEAVRMKEAGDASEVVAVTVGPPEAQETLRTALAMGADRGVLVDAGGAELSPLEAARALRAVCGSVGPGLVLMGKQGIDGDHGATGQMLAGMLGWPQALAASRVTLGAGAGGPAATVTMEVDGGLESVRIGLPAVVTADLRLNKPRFATMRGVMLARRRPLDRVSLADLGAGGAGGAGGGRGVRLLGVSKPAPRPPGVVVGSVDELVEELRARGLVPGQGGGG